MIKLNQEIVNAMIKIADYHCGNINCNDCYLNDGKACISIKMNNLITRYEHAMKKQEQEQKEVE